MIREDSKLSILCTILFSFLHKTIISVVIPTLKKRKGVTILQGEASATSERLAAKDCHWNERRSEHPLAWMVEEVMRQHWILGPEANPVDV